ncbi:hypothetical protein THAOC_37633, partial [Thalassiosira oceanica]
HMYPEIEQGHSFLAEFEDPVPVSDQE